MSPGSRLQTSGCSWRAGGGAPGRTARRWEQVASHRQTITLASPRRITDGMGMAARWPGSPTSPSGLEHNTLHREGFKVVVRRQGAVQFVGVPYRGPVRLVWVTTWRNRCTTNRATKALFNPVPGASPTASTRRSARGMTSTKSAPTSIFGSMPT